MDKKMILLGILIIFLFIGLTGCYSAKKDSDGDSYPDSDDEFPNNADEWIDSDKDGIGNNEDDFPNDATLHEIIYVHDSLTSEKKDESWMLSPGENKELSWSVSDEWKFVYINHSTLEDMNGEWFIQPVCPMITIESPDNTYTIDIENPFLGTIPTENSGEWNVKVENLCDNQIQFRFVISMYK